MKKTILLVVSAIIFMLSANGKNTEIKKNNENKITYIFVNEIDSEKSLDLEPWMMENFSINENIQLLKDENMVLENWMITDFIIYKNIILNEDDILSLERWMTTDFFIYDNINSISDKELNLENWMIDEKYWK